MNLAGVSGGGERWRGVDGKETRDECWFAHVHEVHWKWRAARSIRTAAAGKTTGEARHCPTLISRPEGAASDVRSSRERVKKRSV